MNLSEDGTWNQSIKLRVWDLVSYSLDLNEPNIVPLLYNRKAKQSKDENRRYVPTLNIFTYHPMTRIASKLFSLRLLLLQNTESFKISSFGQTRSTSKCLPLAYYYRKTWTTCYCRRTWKTPMISDPAYLTRCSLDSSASRTCVQIDSYVIKKTDTNFQSSSFFH